MVHGLACGERGLRILDHELAGLDPNPCLEAELDDRGTHCKSCSGGAQCVVLVRLRHTERSQDRISCELLDDSAVLSDALRNHLEELVHASPDDLRDRSP